MFIQPSMDGSTLTGGRADTARNRRAGLLSIGIVLVLAMAFAASAQADTDILRPDENVNVNWAVVGATQKWDAINDPVVNPTDPGLTDLLKSTQNDQVAKLAVRSVELGSGAPTAGQFCFFGRTNPSTKLELKLYWNNIEHESRTYATDRPWAWRCLETLPPPSGQGAVDSLEFRFRTVGGQVAKVAKVSAAYFELTTPPSGTFGVSVGGVIQNEDSTTLEQDLQALEDAGANWIRIDINWAQIQQDGPSSHHWADIDEVVQSATNHELNVLGAINSKPPWAEPTSLHCPPPQDDYSNSRCGPTDPAQYAAFAAEAVAHYSALGVHAYEIWNEPNNKAFWRPTPNASDYTDLLGAAYPAIKAADPQATVLAGAMSPAGTYDQRTGVATGDYAPGDFLDAVYANGGQGFFDAVSHHPYTWPIYPGEDPDPSEEGDDCWSAWRQMYRKGCDPPGTPDAPRSLRSSMAANGDAGKEIWATEFGVPSNGPLPSSTFCEEELGEMLPDVVACEEKQAETVREAYSVWHGYDWAGPLFIYQGRDLGSYADTSTYEDFYGLLRNDFTLKPSYCAYQTAASLSCEP